MVTHDVYQQTKSAGQTRRVTAIRECWQGRVVGPVVTGKNDVSCKHHFTCAVVSTVVKPYGFFHYRYAPYKRVVITCGRYFITSSTAYIFLRLLLTCYRTVV